MFKLNYYYSFKWNKDSKFWARYEMYINQHNTSLVRVAQWIERTPGVREIMGSNPIGDLKFFRLGFHLYLWKYGENVYFLNMKRFSLMSPHIIPTGYISWEVHLDA